MTDAIASRVAGLKLGGIVAVLLVPMLVLSYFMVGSLRHDMAMAQRELLGAKLNRLIMPVAMSAATGVPNDAAAEALRNSGGGLAEDLGIKPKFDTAIAALMTYGEDKRFAVEALADLQVHSANASLVVLDPDPETYHLGVILSAHAPRLLSDFIRVWTLATRALRDGAVSQDEAAVLLIATGRWQESQNRARASLRAAMAASADPQSYEVPLAISDEMAVHPDHISRILGRTPPAEIAARLAQLDEFGAGARHGLGDAEKLWVFAAQNFETLLSARYSGMQLRLYMLLALAAAACLIGVGGAALMFRSTLRQLDEVKGARDEAEAAKADALQAAEEVQRVNEDVVRLNADLARNLAMLREAQDDSLRKSKMAQLGQLTATVAHELRNPLGAVRTSAFLLARKVKDKGLGVEPQIERINNGITRCDNIISQLLDFARSKSLQLETVEFDDWLAKVIEEEAQKLPAAVAIECRLGLGTRSAAIDPARMSRAVINLLSNAAEALVGKGDDPQKFAARSPVITVATRASARGYELTVTDNGAGIAAEHLEKIFEPLFTTKSFGTGLGLPAVMKIMEQHGGSIEVTSATGQGASFTLWWPTEVRLKEAS